MPWPTLTRASVFAMIALLYYERFAKSATNWRRRATESGGAGGTVTRDVFIQPAVTLRVGDVRVVLRDVSIAPSRMNAGLDLLFGNLGQDFIAGFKSFTLDFVKMTFSVET